MVTPAGPRRRAWMVAAPLLLAGVAGCYTASPGPPIPAMRSGELAAFSGEAELRAFLAEAARARPLLRVQRGEISEFGGRYPYIHVEERVRPLVVYDAAPGVITASALVVDGGGVWATRERELSHAAIGASVPANAESLALPRDLQTVVERGLLPVPGGLLAMARQRCGEAGVDVARVPFDGQALRICGRLVGEPVLARAGAEILFYGAFDALDEGAAEGLEAAAPPPAIVLPSLRTPGGKERTLFELGPVYYPAVRGADLIVRVLLRCNARLGDCEARSFVSARSTIDALWIDASRVALGFADDRGRAVVVDAPRGGGAPRVAHLDRWVIGLAGLGGGRLAIVRADRAVRSPYSRAIPRLATLDGGGRVLEGGALPVPVTGREGNWRWAVHGDRLVYGPSRTHNFGGADTPRLVVAAIPSGPVDVQPIGPSADAILFAGEDAIVAGSTASEVHAVVQRRLAGAGPWREHAYGSSADPRARGIEQSGRAMLLEVGGRRIVVVPTIDLTYTARYQLRVLELGPSGVTVLATVAMPSPAVQSSAMIAQIAGDDRLGALVLGERVVLRVPGELVVLELGAGEAREVGRVTL